MQSYHFFFVVLMKVCIKECTFDEVKDISTKSSKEQTFI